MLFQFSSLAALGISHSTLLSVDILQAALGDTKPLGRSAYTRLLKCLSFKSHATIGRFEYLALRGFVLLLLSLPSGFKFEFKLGAFFDGEVMFEAAQYIHFRPAKLLHLYVAMS